MLSITSFVSIFSLTKNNPPPDLKHVPIICSFRLAALLLIFMKVVFVWQYIALILLIVYRKCIFLWTLLRHFEF